MKIIFFLLLISFLSSCTEPTYVTENDIKSKTPFIHKVIYKVDENYDTDIVDCIAVLPFTSNLKKETQVFNSSELIPTDIVRRSFFAHLSPYAFRDIEIERINYLFDQNKLDNLSAKQFLSTNYNCNYIIEGQLTKFSKNNLAVFSNISIGVNTKLIDTKNNLIIWEASELKQSRGGDLPISPLSLLSSFYRSYKNTQDEKIFNLIDEVNRHLIHTLPKPTFAIFVEPAIFDYNEKELLADLKNSHSIQEKEIILTKLYKQIPIKEKYLLSLANFYFANGRYEESFNLLQSNQEKFSKNDKILFLIARNGIKLKKYNIAKSNLIKAIRLDKKNINYYNALGFIYSITSDTDKALSAYQMGIDIDKNDSFAHYNMAIEYYNRGELEKSVIKLVDAGNSYLIQERKDKLLMVISTLDAIKKEGIVIDDDSYQLFKAGFKK